MFKVVIALLQFSSFVQAETVNPETMLDVRHQPTYTWRGVNQLNENIREEVKYLRSIQKKSGGLDYAYINKRTPNGAFATYLVELKSGRILDTFPSLIGYRGMGCGKGQTPPGVIKLTDTVGQGASRKPHWGNNWKLYVMKNIQGVSRCPPDGQIVAHSNVNLSGKDTDDKIKSKSAGCFTVPPDRLAQMHKYAGNAYIYNVPMKTNAQ